MHQREHLQGREKGLQGLGTCVPLTVPETVTAARKAGAQTTRLASPRPEKVPSSAWPRPSSPNCWVRSTSH